MFRTISRQSPVSHVIAWTLTRCSHNLPQLCQSFLLPVPSSVCYFSSFSFFLINLGLWGFADETFVTQHTVDTGQFFFQTSFLFFQTLDLFFNIHQFCKRNIDYRLRNYCRYCIVCDTVLIRLYQNFTCRCQCCKEDLPFSKVSLTDASSATTYTVAFFARRYIHLGTYATDASDCLFNHLNIFFILFEIPLFFSIPARKRS